MSGRKTPLIDLSIVITTHSEGILIHRTLASVKRAVSALKNDYHTEIILHADNPSEETLDYINDQKNDALKNVRVFINSFKDLGASRNFAIQQANGNYIATIDADDLMSKNWLKDSLDHLVSCVETTVAHSEVTVEFEGADSLILKHGEINRETDTLLSVYANRWNSVIVAPRSVLLENPYTPNSPGYGYEDWHLNCRLITKGIHNILIPNTVIFVRRKKLNSEWSRQINSMVVLRANPALSFKNIRDIADPFKHSEDKSYSLSVANVHKLRMYTKKVISKQPLTYKIARHVKKAIKHQQAQLSSRQSHVPSWLMDEWRQMHDIEKQIFPTNMLMSSIPIYDTLTEDHKLAGILYKQLISSINKDAYDYLIFVPWLVKGGADQYSINYANTIAELKPHKRVLVVGTLPVASPWINKLHSDVDFLDFGNITKDAPTHIKHRLMEHVVENSGVTHIHIINSEFGYDFVRLHEVYIKATDKKIIVTSFSQSTDEVGRLYGYSHTHVPSIYGLTSYITTDNNAVIDMWRNDYGFKKEKLLIHRQPIKLDGRKIHRNPQSDTTLQILWAARISYEKQPELVAKIAHLLKDTAVIHMYGAIEKGNESHISNLPSNVIYKGSFDGLHSLPLDTYDALLYTSLFDGMPNTILEAAQAKLPVIASDVGGISEFITDETGLLISDIKNPSAYVDAVSSLSNDVSLGAHLANGAYKKLEKEFSTKKYIENINDLLKSIRY